MVKIFVGGVSPAVTGEELKKLFEKFGQVNECDILKNYAFVHMEKEDEAHRAISELHKHEFHGAHLTVEYATSKIRNATKIYVGNVASSATTAQLKELFERFGKVVECDIVKNYAFVHMAKEREAMDAILHLNDTPLEDQKIFVTLSKSNNSMKGIGKGGSVAAPPPHPSYLFHRTRLPPPPPHFPHYPARSWYDRDYYERYSYDLYDRTALGARSGYERALPPPPPPPSAAASAAAAVAAATNSMVSASSYRDRSPIGRRTAVSAQYADPYGASQGYAQGYSQGYASAYSQYGYSDDYYEKYASAYMGQYGQSY
ncbi:RNA-binding protein 4-like isoform X1 [Rhinatrema bivittatum]|uniref:RNA-binding protein 4-like isoform X1 n=1 Tax=Rhinatrema bivittatum TaxID=194408 RepID=UPI001129C350|nr:RNA-binding protein 4-like isoform X1 [Rhinatrema bivittatum]XP_029469962.1 RNA-binding protein 4-like isoform X1 [Rhinatrema bivittatum]